MKILNKILKHLDELIKQANFAPSIYQIGFGQMDDKHLENLLCEDETWKVRLIEEKFKRLMFEVQDV